MGRVGFGHCDGGASRSIRDDIACLDSIKIQSYDQKTLSRLFEEQALKTPYATAVVCDDSELNYLELNLQANQLARHIRSLYQKINGEQFKSDTLVALYFEKNNINLIISILAVLKAGGAYVPVDPHYPVERISFILSDTGSPLVLTEFSSNDKLDSAIKNNTSSVSIIPINEERYAHESAENLWVDIQSNDLAYVIYTSGTTGHPKGVMISQSALSLFLLGFKNRFVKEGAAVLSVTYYTFDIFGLEYGLPLISGNTLVLSNVDKFKKDFELHKNHIQLIQQTPSVLNIFLDELPDTVNPFNITCLVGGEPVSLSMISKLKKQFARVINVYGPTEATIWSTAYESDDGKNYIGRALHDEKTYVLDDQLNVVKNGEIGELHIGGAGIARGYLNLHEKTKENFIKNPFATVSDLAKGYDRLYKTGDLVRCLPCGNIEFVGRRDFQIKIRGHRIELTEIENVLLSVEHIKQCVVVAELFESTTFLIAYYVSAVFIEEDVIADVLSAKLPSYMMPSFFVCLEKFPLTSNGKIDRKSLSKPDVEKPCKEYIAPHSHIEKLLCDLWSKMLSISYVGLSDNFFRLGGNSILAIQCAHRMSEIMNTKIEVVDIFLHKNITNILLNIRHKEIIVIPNAEQKEFPLSFEQERLYFIEQYEGSTNTYHVPMLFSLSKTTKQEILLKSIQSIVHRHAVLHSVFYHDKLGKNYQKTTEKMPKVEHYIFPDEEKYLIQLKNDIDKPFNLENDLPIIIYFYHIKQNDVTYLLINIHHAVFDGWSIDIFMNELHAYYEHYHSQKPLLLDPLKTEYRDYAVWQRDYNNAKNIKLALSYWEAKLKGYETLTLPLDKPRPKKFNYEGNTISFSIPELLSTKLRTFSKEKGSSLYSLLLSCFYTLLYHYTHQRDIVIGTPVANRQHKQLENTIGFFVNTVALRIQLQPQTDTILALVNKIQNDLIDIQRYQDLQFEQLIDQLGVERDISLHPLFQVMFGVQSFGRANNDIFSSVSLENIYTPARFDLSLFIDDSEEKLKGTLNYAIALFDFEKIERMVSHYINILDSLMLDPSQKIQNISLLSSSEYKKIVYDWNQTDFDFHENRTIIELFEEQALRKPHNIAITFCDEKVSYEELNNQTNQLARYIKNYYEKKQHDIFKPGTLVALYFDRGIHVITAILAVLKIGGVYVPVDPKYPVERVTFIAQDAKTPLFLTQDSYAKNLTAILDPSILVLPIDNEASRNESPENFQNQCTTEMDPIYIIYTSGTTGKPKGVILKQKGVVNMACAQKKEFSIDSTSIVLQFSSMVFDASAWEIFSALVCGAKLAIPTEAQRHDPDELTKYIELEKVSIATIPPSLLSQTKHHLLPYLKTLIVAGEPCDVMTMKYWGSGRDFINAYGPTETTVCATWHHYSFGDSAHIIGRPLKNTRTYILDPHHNPVPIGVIGELYVGGVGLALGYLNQPVLTKERFIQNQFATDDDLKNGYTQLYRTGDLVKYLPNGEIEYIGRNDFQVKIRGHRIELGEIENALNRQNSIKQSVALITEKNNGEKQIVSYYVSDNALDENILLKNLRTLLPSYMLPNFCIHLYQLPININGKIDIRALPQPDFSTKNNHYVAPRNSIEQKLCVIWQELLCQDKVGIYDDFFTIGGNSILAIQLVAQTSVILNINIAVADIFIYKTIAELSTHFKDQAIFLIPVCEIEQPRLSFSQESLWFIEQYEQGSNLYNIPVLLTLKKEASIEHFLQAIQCIVNRHEILRTVIGVNEIGETFQKVIDESLLFFEISFKTHKACQLHLHKEINRSFDLRHEPPIRIFHYVISDNKITSDRKILINLHHIAFDAWAINVFFRELDSFYKHFHDGSLIESPKLDIQYKDYAHWQSLAINTEKLASQLLYWEEKLKNYETINFPLDKSRPAKQDHQGGHVKFQLSDKLSNRLRQYAKKTGYSLYTILLTGFYILLHKYCGQNDLIIGSPNANRDHFQTQNLIGYFVNSLALRMHFTADIKLADLIEQVNRTLIEAKQNQDIPFENIVKQLVQDRDSSRHPIFQVMFNFQALDPVTELSSLWDSEINFLENNTAKFDLLLLVEDANNESLRGYFNYAVSLFERNTITRLCKHLKTIFQSVVDETAKDVAAITLIAPKERKKLLYDWNKTDVHFESTKTLAQKFEAQVLKTPNNIALDFEGVELTYCELNQKANQLARYLRKQYRSKTGVALTPDTLIAIYVERSIEMLVSILAIFKAGGAYVPLSPEHPMARTKNLLEDSKAKMLLTQPKFFETLLPLKDQIEIMSIVSAECSSEATDNLNIQSASENLACVLYTSGTTGQPKGVLIEQKSLINHIEWLQSKINLTENDVVIQKASYIYDASVRELLWANWYGAKTVLAKPDGHKDSAYLYALIKKHNARLIHFIPSMLDAFLNYIDATENTLPDSLQVMICGGEMLKENLVDTCYRLAKHDDFVLYNVYGPTEITINATHSLRSKQRAGVIGRPNSNMRAYILDERFQPQPVGVIGELYIGGVGVTRGYLHNDALTKERYGINPFATQSDKEQCADRIYKTGDLARYLPDGNIECVGRNDFQVKIRGYRIELGEIEKALSSVTSIQESVVIPYARKNSNDDQKYLVAYYVSSVVLSHEILTQILSHALPDYMIPTIFMRVEKLPVSITGKLDRNALPEPTFGNMIKKYAQPTTIVEKKLCILWEELLGIEKIGIHDDFFHLGGNSLLTIQLLARIIKSLNVSITLKDIFENKTVKNIAEKIEKTNSISSRYAKPITKRTEKAIFSQQQKLTLNYLKNNIESTLFQSGIALLLEENIDPVFFELALKSVVNMYPLFRTKFCFRNSKFEPEIFSSDKVDFSSVFSSETFYVENISEQRKYAENLRLKMSSRIFDYQNTFLYKIKLINTPKKTSMIIVSMSRLLADGYSLNMFVKSLFEKYKLISMGVSIIDSTSLDYFDYSAWQKKTLNKKSMKKNILYWLDSGIGSAIRELVKPDKNRHGQIDGLCECERVQLDVMLSDKIRFFSKENKISVYSLFFAAWASFLAECSGQNEICIACVHRNRNTIESENIQGPFSDYLPIQLKNVQWNRKNTYKFLTHVDRLIRDGLDHAVPYPLLLEALNVSKEDQMRYCNFPFTQTAVNFPSPYVKTDSTFPKIEYLPNTKHTTGFELSLVISESASCYSLSLNYRGELFSQKIIFNILKKYIEILKEIVN